MSKKTDEGLAAFENTRKNLEQSWNEYFNKSSAIGDQLTSMLDNINKQFTQATDRIIQTDFEVDNKKTYYKTTINSVTGTTTSDFPIKPTDENDVFWKLHMKLVDEALATRKELQLKIVETIGATVKGLFNPISVSNIDLVKIISAMVSVKK